MRSLYWSFVNNKAVQSWMKMSFICDSELDLTLQRTATHDRHERLASPTLRKDMLSQRGDTSSFRLNLSIYDDTSDWWASIERNGQSKITVETWEEGPTDMDTNPRRRKSKCVEVLMMKDRHGGSKCRKANYMMQLYVKAHRKCKIAQR